VPARDLIPFAGGRTIYAPIPDDAEGILVHTNARDESAFDLYRIAVPDGRPPVLLATNPGDVARWGVDRGGRLLWRQRTVGPRERAIEVFIGDHWAPGFVLGPDDALEVLGPAAEPFMAWALSNRFRECAGLVKLHLRTGEEEVYHREDGVDVDGALLDPATGEPLAAWAWPDHQKLAVFDDGLRHDLDPLTTAGPAQVRIRSIDREKRRLVVSVQTEASGTDTFLLDRNAGSRTLLSGSVWSRHLDTLSATRPIRLAARDGLTLHGYLTLPKGYAPSQLPTVVSVHGGPWVRDYLDMGLEDQFLANRGYAVLKINYRGSAGYGRAFQRAGNKEFGGKIDDDIVDGVRWLVDRGVADPKRVAIMGASFGGYVTLSALLRYPDVFAAGVAVSAPSHLPSLLEDFPKAWTNEMWQWARFAGDLGDREDLQRMEERSPLNRASRMNRPLLIVYGANDVRTPRDQAGRLIAELRRHGKEFKFLILMSEGHSFQRASSRAAYFRAVEDFLAEHLGGRKSAAN
jgi:dipeptidyl aminopeptidase/acylaminoacyl peptidase